MKISIVIPTRNKGELLASRLRPLFHQTLPSDQYEIVVVNNASTDQTSEVLATLRREGENFRWVMEPVPGRPQARNRGIREAAGDLIVLLDDDIEVQADHLERHLAYHTQAADRITVVGHVVDVSPIQPAWLADYVLARQGMVAGAPDAASAEIPAGLRLATGNVSMRLSSRFLSFSALLSMSTTIQPGLLDACSISQSLQHSASLNRACIESQRTSERS